MRSTRFLLPTLAALAAMPAASALDVGGVQIHGFASQGYLASHDNEIFAPNSNDGGTFDFNEFGINFTATPVDRLRVGAQLFAGSLGQDGKEKVKLDWGYGEYQIPTGKDNLDVYVQAGRLKMGLGLYNDFRDLDMTRTQVFLPMSVYNPNFRDIFIAVNGAAAGTNLRTGALGTFGLFGFFGGQTIDEDGPLGAAFVNPELNNTVDSISVKHQAGGALTWETPLEGLRLKGSFMGSNQLAVETHILAAAPPFVGTVEVPISMPHYYNSIVSAEYQHGDLTLAAEYSNAQGKIITELPPMLGGGTNVQHLRTQGAYGSAAYRFLERWEALGAYVWSYESEIVHDPVASFNRGVVVALRCDITDHWLIKGEFQRNRGTAFVSDGDDEYWSLFAVKTTFDF